MCKTQHNIQVKILHSDRGGEYTLKGAKGDFNCDKQKVNGSGNSPQLRAKGSEGRMAERGDKKN